MKRDLLEEKVVSVLTGILNKQIKRIDPQKELKSELSLDSIQIVELFVALEQEFEMELPLQMMTVKTGKEFLNLLEIQLNQKAIGNA